MDADTLVHAVPQALSALAGGVAGFVGAGGGGVAGAGAAQPLWLAPFVGTAALLAALSTAALVVTTRGQRAWSAGLTLGVPVAVLGLYLALGNPRALDPAQRQRPLDAPTMVERLAQRLQQGQGSAQDWLMLARSWRSLGRHADADAAYARAEPLLAQDVDSLADWVECRMLAAGRRFDARALQLLARARALDAQHPGVLLLDGLAALQQGDRPRARRQLAALRAQQAEGSADREALDRALAALDAGRDPRQALAPGAAAR